MEDDRGRHPIARLDAEDLEFVPRFVPASGSLKEAAARSGVSYPTIRSQFDRLIGRLRQFCEGRSPGPMAELLSDAIERGQLPPRLAKQILQLHRDRPGGRSGPAEGG